MACRCNTEQVRELASAEQALQEGLALRYLSRTHFKRHCQATHLQTCFPSQLSFRVDSRKRKYELYLLSAVKQIVRGGYGFVCLKYNLTTHLSGRMKVDSREEEELNSSF
jgi:hypothetical protein